MEIETEFLGECSVDEIKQGYVQRDENCICLICGARFNKGEVYTFSNKFYEGSKAIAVHIKQEHQSIINFLLNTKANNMGISELQLQLLNFFAKGLTDKEIADYLGVSNSTIRNHRYKLRERERQNKLFLALMELLQEDGLKGGKSSTSVASSPHMMETHLVSEKEKNKVLERYMTLSGRLKSYPMYERSKRIVLEAVLKHFSIGKRYSEKEVDHLLREVYKDSKFLRDELMAYDYLDRTDKGAIYWIKDYKELDKLG